MLLTLFRAGFSSCVNYQFDVDHVQFYSYSTHTLSYTKFKNHRGYYLTSRSFEASTLIHWNLKLCECTLLRSPGLLIPNSSHLSHSDLYTVFHMGHSEVELIL